MSMLAVRSAQAAYAPAWRITVGLWPGRIGTSITYAPSHIL